MYTFIVFGLHFSSTCFAGKLRWRFWVPIIHHVEVVDETLGTCLDGVGLLSLSSLAFVSSIPVGFGSSSLNLLFLPLEISEKYRRETYTLMLKKGLLCLMTCDTVRKLSLLTIGEEPFFADSSRIAFRAGSDNSFPLRSCYFYNRYTALLVHLIRLCPYPLSVHEGERVFRSIDRLCSWQLWLYANVCAISTRALIR